MTLDWAQENKLALGYRYKIIMVAAQAATDEPLNLEMLSEFLQGVLW